MNNKINVNFNATPSWDTTTNQSLRASKVDELLFFSNDIVVQRNSAVPNEDVTEIAFADSFYVPEGLTDFGGSILVGETATRQDIKRKLAIRLPQVTLGQGLLTISASNNMAQYFMNSIVYKTSSGYVRWGIANFTANQATNPLVDGNQGTLQALWSFFDIDSTNLVLQG
jgi:hypothetical protein